MYQRLPESEDPAPLPPNAALRRASRELTLQQVYSARFVKTSYRSRVWQVIAPFFSQWVPPSGKVLDVGAGYCEFINSAKAGAKYAMDLNPDIRKRAARDVLVLQQDCAAPWPLSDNQLDTVFTSNFLEHLPHKNAINQVLRNAHRSLKRGGYFIAMGPNIKYLGGAYWDFFDHYVALTEQSLAEALTNCGFTIERMAPRFLPYTMSQGHEYPMWMLRLYLAVPIFWRIFGKQFLIVARKK